MAEAAPGTRSSQSTILVMTSLAAIAVGLAIAEPERSMRASITGSLALLIPVVLIAWILGNRTRRASPVRLLDSESLPAGIVAGLIVLFVMSYGVEVAREAFSGRRVMPEIILIAALRNLTLGMTSLSHRPALARLAVLLDLFLICISSAMAKGQVMIIIVALFAPAGCLWLLLSHRGSVRLIGPIEGRDHFPLATATFLMMAAGSVFVLAAVGPTRAATALIGLMPTSGGTDWNDPDSLGGVNDGDNEVSASQNPQSVGFTESEIYLESDRPSLYDAFNEQYGEAIRPKKQERMIALAPTEVREQKERPSENLQAGRQFPMLRRKPTREGFRPREREAKALIYLKGPCPIHIPLVAYDHFDGKSWSEAAHCTTRCPLEREGKGAWLRVGNPTSTALQGTVTHQVKIGTLDSSPLPIPAQIARLRVGSVDQPDFFGWAQEGIVKMQGRTVPAGTLIDVESFTVDHSELGSVEFPEPSSPLTDRYLASASGGYRIDPAVAALVGTWVSGRTRGWGQVESVVSALRGTCVHDRTATIPEDCPDPVRHFLLDSRRGADYEFATAAAVVLRTLGYPCRLVSGFYASSERYDPRTRHTPVLSEDAHFWAEVRLPNGVWIAVEPTPGYALMAPALSWSRRLVGVINGVIGWLKTNWPGLCLSALSLISALRFRRELADAVLTLGWWLTPGRDESLLLDRTFRLIERRSRWAGNPRPFSSTPRRWYGGLAPLVETGRPGGDLATVLASLERVFYAPVGGIRGEWPGGGDAATACRRVIETWTLSRLRTVRRGIPS